MIVLSLFDGISCGQVALKRIGVPVEKYYASEIDKAPISITQYNFPNTIQLGDVTKWREWDIDWGKIDLLMAGSPCQSLSVSGKREGFEGKSGIIEYYFQILEHIKILNPNVKFLLENVKMKKEWSDVITKRLGVDFICIDSSLVSAQCRKRLYWSNIPNITQPEDRGIVLKDIIAYSRSTRYPNHPDKEGSYVEARHRDNGKANTLTCGSGCGSFSSKNLIFLGGLEKGLRLLDGKKLSRNYREGSRVYSVEGKSATLTSQSKGGSGGFSGNYGTSMEDFRQLYPQECELLQTLDVGYTQLGLKDGKTIKISDSARYKAIGNGWTVEVIAHILKNLIDLK
jgi:DNA (cytosine-5)-methyltransferase 3A